MHEIDFPGGKKRIIVGDDSPVKLLTPAKYLDISLDAKAGLVEMIDNTHRGLVYVVEGELELNDYQLQTGQACFIEGQDSLAMKAITTTRLMLSFAQPHGEPIRQYGPFVD